MKKPTAKKKSAEKANAPAAVVNMGRLLEDVELLEKHFAINPAALDDARLEWIQVVMTSCQNILARKAMTLGCATAIGVLHAQTCYGIEALNHLSKDEKSREALKKKAAENTVWPMMLSRKESSRDAAKDRMEEIGLGGSADSNFKPLASALRLKIQACIELLTYTQSTRSRRKVQDANLPVAKQWESKFPGLRDLPPFNSETSAKWWPVAKAMLKDYWSNHPEEKEASFKMVRSAAETENKVEAKATEYVKKAFIHL